MILGISISLHLAASNMEATGKPGGDLLQGRQQAMEALAGVIDNDIRWLVARSVSSTNVSGRQQSINMDSAGTVEMTDRPEVDRAVALLDTPC